jgi:hypothetical protein
VTLESELGIRANGRPEPDFDGWEVKGFLTSNYTVDSSGPMTLMTPEPTGGFYRDEGIIAFVEQFGYTDRRGRPNRRNFGGVHQVDRVCSLTGLTMVLDGFDAAADRIVRADGAVALLDAKGRTAASWNFAGLLEHWQRKHRQAAYVPAEKRDSESGLQYRYGDRILLAEGANFNHLLAGFARGDVYYDPAIKVERARDSITTKRRSQFRINRRQLPSLYDRHQIVRACATH